MAALTEVFHQDRLIGGIIDINIPISILRKLASEEISFILL